MEGSLDTLKEESTLENHYLNYAKDSSIIAVTQIIISLLLFLRLPLLTKCLGAYLYGTWSIIWVTITLAASLATLGLNSAVVRFLAPEKDVAEIRQGFLSTVVAVFGTGLLCCIILILCSVFFAKSILLDKSAIHLIQLSSLMIITQALTQIGIAFFRTFRQIKWYSSLLVGKATLELSLIVCLLMIDWKLIGIITAILTSDIVFIFIIFSLVFKQVGFEMPRFTHLMSYLRYGLPLMPSSAILWITHFSDRYIIGYFMEAKEVGIYSAAYALSNILVIFISPLQVTLLPTISKSYQEGDKDRTEVYLNYSWKFLIMLAIPAVFGISIMAVPLLSTLTTSEFINGSSVIPLIASGILFYSLYQVCIHIFYLVNKTSWILSILGLASVFNVGLNLLLVPRFGIVGAGVANMLANGLVAILTVYISFKYYKFNLNLGFIIKSAIASSLMALTIWFLNPTKIYQIITSILLGIIIYTVLLLALKGIDKNEFRFLKNLVMGFNTAGNKY